MLIEICQLDRDMALKRQMSNERKHISKIKLPTKKKYGSNKEICQLKSNYKDPTKVAS